MIDFDSPFERKSTVLNFLHEAPEDQVPTVDTGAGDDAGGDAPDEGFEAAPADDTGDNNDNQDDTAANEDNDDFTIDADDTGMDDGEDTGGGNEGGENNSAADAEVDNEAKRKDREIFDTLSPQEQKIKTVKLKELFMDLYNRCDQISDKLNSIGVDYEDLGSPIHKSVETLYSLKEMISTYLLYMFDSKSYIENDITFNRFLTALNQIKLVTKDMRNAHKDDIDLQNDTENE